MDRLFRCFLIAGCFLTASTVLAAPHEINRFLEQNCVDCHTGEDAERSFELSEIAFPDSLTEAFDSEPWEKILSRVASRQMPPPDAAKPSEAEYESFTNALSVALGDAAEKYPRPGRTLAMRRLTRTEYQNAIRDLLDVQIDASQWLPKDPSSHGFDNITVGELSPTLLSRYLAAAQKISELALGRPRGPVGATIRLPADRTQEKHVEGLPLGTRGGVLVHHHFPQSGEYEIALRLTRDRDEKVEGLNEQHDIDVLIDRKKVHRFSVSPPPGRKDYTHSDSHLKTRIQVSAGPHKVGVTFPNKFSSLAEIKRQPFDAQYNRHRHPRNTPALFQVSIVGPLGVADPSNQSASPSRDKILGVQGDGSDLDRASEILNRIMRRAYRREVTKADLESPLWFFQEGLREDGFEAGIEAAITSILVNPNFLFRVEAQPTEHEANQPYRINDYELATRLSFFLWSSIPDDVLLDLAAAAKLHQPEILRQQVLRLLEDPRSETLVTNFAAQWLYLRNLDSITPDLRLFPDFDDNLRQAFRRETELLFADVVRRDRSVLRLIDSDETFLNERLAVHYGIPHVQGSHFRRVKLNERGLVDSDSLASTQRGGLLRHGSILTVTSYATRTSPTIRGHWILKNILGTPPPPPPPNVPNLKEKTALAATSIRERLAQHREDPACASCHALMDPVGFALENYDALGRWRDFDGTLPIDVAGTMPDGSEIGSAAEMEAGILERPELFVGTLAEKLMTFALGRGVTHEDGPAIRHITATASQHDHSFSSIVLGIVNSRPFQMRIAE